MNHTSPAVSLRNVNKSFGGVKAVCDVSCDIAYGERRLFIGTNGAGKTTLFNLIAGDLPVTSGTIEIFGENVNKLSVQQRVRKGMKRTYQTSALMDGLSVWQNLYLSLLGIQPIWQHINIFGSTSRNKEMNKKIQETAERIGLTHRLSSVVRDLSHGERRQLELGTALITEPKLLLLDEPAAGLSAEERVNLIGLIQDLPRDITVVLVEHDMQMAFAVADYVTLMYDGNVVAEGSVEEIQNNKTVQEIYLGGTFNGSSDA